jgi:hypothetical protein
MKMKRLADWNLRNKIILHVGVIGFLTALFLSYFCTRTQRNVIFATSTRKAELVGAVVQGSIFEAMKAGQPDEVRAILENIALSQDIQKIRIVNPEGKILNSSHSEEIGETIFEGPKESLKKFLSDPESAQSVPRKSGKFLKEYRLITNDPDCHACHNPQAKINGVLEVSLDYSPVFSILKTNTYRGILISLASLTALSIIILRLFERLINRPLSRLKKSMKKIQGGDMTSLVPAVKDDEIGSLAKSFNVMVAQLEEANKKIEKLHERQMEKAEHLASLGEIAAGLAHEIKNPIAGMKGALEIIHQKTDGTDKQVFREILSQIERIDHIVQDLLSYAKPKELNIRLVSLKDCVENVIRLARMQVKNKDIQFLVSEPESGIRARVDTDKIQEVLLNLILNSISAIDRKGTIRLTLCTENKKDLKITVADDGKGIKKEQISQIFQPFFTTKSDGTGLGLSICKKTITAHSGTIEVESEEGKGTTFSIVLPAVEPGE